MGPAEEIPSRDGALPPRPPRPPVRRQAIPVKSERGLPDVVRIQICRYLIEGLQVKGIAKQLNCSDRAVYNVKQNLIKYGNVRAPPQVALGAKQKISDEDADALFEALTEKGWMAQAAMRDWLLAERGTAVSQSTISRFLVDRGWTQRSLKPYLNNGQGRAAATAPHNGTLPGAPTAPHIQTEKSPDPSPTERPAYVSPYPPAPSPGDVSYVQSNSSQQLRPVAQSDNGSLVPTFEDVALDAVS